MKHSNNIIYKILLTLTLFFNLLHAEKLDKITLQLQWKHQFESAGFYMAKEKGFYSDVGLDVAFVEFHAGTNIIDEVVSTPNMYGITYSNIISEYLKGKPIVFVANFFKQSPLAIVATKDIKQPSDLIGKKVMGVGNDINSAMVLVMFRKFGISKEDFTHIAPTFHIDEFINGDVDAMAIYTTNETYFLDKLGVEYNLLNPTVYGAEFYDINLFTSKKETDLHPDRVLKFKEASIKGWEYALEHKKETIELILKKYNTQNKSLESLQYEANQIENIMLPKIYPVGSIDTNRVRLMLDNFKELGLVSPSTKIDFEEFIFTKYKYNIRLTKDDIIEYVIILFVLLFILTLILYVKLKQKVLLEVHKNKEQESLIHYYSKQESMKNMLGNISHQWRHPLSELSSEIMILDTKLSLNQELSSDEIREMTTNSKHIINFMSKTIDTFNNFYKKATDDENKQFYIKDAIDETLFILKGSFEVKNIKIDMEIDDSLQIVGNINQLEQVILSILVNAQDMFEKREIKKPTITISAYKEKSNIFIEIKDNAGGIKSKNINDIFKLTISEKNSSGLGLFISKHIIEDKFHGTIEVFNVDDGAIFRTIV